MNGALLVDKPSGPTSHDIVAFARRALQTREIGHTGTLDPLATGLLVLLIGHATRLSQFLVTDEKAYIADIRLGRSTPTYDADPAFRLKAEATGSHAVPGSHEEPDPSLDSRGFRLQPDPSLDSRGFRLQPDPSLDSRGFRLQPDPSLDSRGFRLQAEDVDRVLAEFLGTFPQLPPPFSAKKVGGERAYKKARRNEPVELKPVQVTVRELEIIANPAPGGASRLAPRDSDPTLLRLRIVCSSGFYVRSLAHDIGQLLGCGAHLEALRRTRAGQFDVADALSLEALEGAGAAVGARLLDPNTLLAAMPAVKPTEEGHRRAWNGNTLGPPHLEAPVAGLPGGTKVRVLSSSGGVLAVAEWRPDGLLHPLVVLR